jgi:hypothetical protein
VFSVSGTITLGSSLPAIQNEAEIDGAGNFRLGHAAAVSGITIDGANSFRIMTVNQNATLVLTQITLTHGNVAGDGGAIVNNACMPDMKPRRAAIPVIATTSDYCGNESSLLRWNSPDR